MSSRTLELPALRIPGQIGASARSLWLLCNGRFLGELLLAMPVQRKGTSSSVVDMAIGASLGPARNQFTVSGPIGGSTGASDPGGSQFELSGSCVRPPHREIMFQHRSF